MWLSRSIEVARESGMPASLSVPSVPAVDLESMRSESWCVHAHTEPVGIRFSFLSHLFLFCSGIWGWTI